MEIGKRIYYDIITGEIIQIRGQAFGSVHDSSVEEDIVSYKNLSERNKETFDYISLEYGEYERDFQECSGYRINIETRALEFSYPDPTNPIEPIFQVPLTTQIELLKLEVSSQIQLSSDFMDYAFANFQPII